MFNLPDKLTGLFTPPVFEDKEKKRIAGRLNIILLCGLGLVAAAGIVNVATSPRPIPRFITACALLGGLSVHLLLYHKGYIRLVRLLFPITGWVMITLLVLFSGGINSPSLAGYISLILGVGLIFGMRHGTGTTATMYEGVLLINPDGRIVQSNPAAERILGRKRSEIEGRSYVSPEWEILRPDGTPMPPEEMAAPRAMKEKRAVNDVVMVVRRPDGSICWINVNAAPIMDAAGQLEAVVGTFADITARKQAEFAERKRAEETLRKAHDELEIRVQERVAELAQAREALQAELTERKRAEEALRKAHDELEIRVQERVAELAQARETLQAESAEHKRAEEELRKSDERYRIVVEDVPALICRFLPDGTLSFVNNAYCRYFSKTHEELIGHNFFQFIPVEDREKVREHYDSISKEKPAITYEHQVIALDGTIRWQRWTARGLFDESGVLVEYQSIGEDIAERQQAEEAFAMEQERPSTTLRGIGDGVIATDVDRQAVLINQAAETLTGRSQEEALPAEFAEPKQADEGLHNLIEIIQFTEHVSAKLHGLVSAAEIYRTVKEEFAQLKRYTTSIVLLTDDASSLRIAEASLSSAKVEAGEKASGLRLKGYKIDLKKSGTYRQVVREGKTVQVSASDITGELFPRPLARLVLKALGVEKESSILTPLKRHGKIIGAFALTCPEFAEHFIPSVKNLAQHISIALEWADEYSERKRAEEALKESEARYRLLIDGAHNPITVYDSDGTLLLMNVTAATMVGGEPDDFVGKSVREVHPGVADSAMERIRQVIESGERREFETTMELPSGRRWFLSNFQPVRDASGKILAVQIVSYDITERKRVEEALRESEERYRTLFEQSPIGITTLDLKGVITSCNPAVYRKGGYTENELIGKHFSKIAPLRIRDIPKFLKVFSSIKGGKVPDPIEVAYQRKDGKIGWTEVHTAVLEAGGKKTGVQVLQRDITEHKQAEEALRESAGKYRSLVESTDDAVYLISRDMRYEFANGKYLSRLGLSLAELVRQEYGKLHPWDTNDEFAKKVDQVIKSGKPMTYEHLSPRDNKYFMRTLSPVTGEKPGEIKAISVTSKDITERKQAEESLRESEERYRKLFEEARDGIFLADAETGVIVDCNRAAAELVGRDKSEFIGQHQKILHPPRKVKGRFTESFKKHLEDGEGQVLEEQVITSSGEIKEVAIKANLLNVGGRKLLQGMFRDITERKRAGEALRESREMYQELYNEAPVGYHEIDLEGIITRVNQTETEMLGYSVDEMIGKPVWDFLAPDQRDIAKEAVLEKLRELQPLKDFGQKYVRKDGREIDVHITERQIVDSEGRVSGIRSTLQDITERKRAEETLRESEVSYRGLADSISDVFFAMDKDLRYIYWNKASEEQTGIPAKDAIGKSLYEIFPDIKGTRVSKLFQEILKSKKPRHFINEYQLGGKNYIFEVRAYPSKDGISVLQKDITEQKQAEEALIRTNRALRLVSECNQALVREKDEIQLLDAICEIIVDIGGYRLAWVGLAEHDRQKTVRPVSWVGYEKGYLETLKITWADTEQRRGPTGTAIRTGEPVIARDIPNDPAFAPWRKEALKRDYASSIALPLKIADQAIGALNIYSPEPDAFIDEEINLLRELGDDLAYGIMALRAQTERKQAEKALRESEQNLIKGQEIAQMGYWKLNIVTEEVEGSDELLRIFGLGRDEMTLNAFSGAVHPEDREYDLEHIQKGIEQGAPWDIEHRLLFKDGTIKWIRAIGEPNLDENGKTTHIMGIVQDITERKRVEEALAMEQERLSTTLRGIVDGVITTDIDLQVVLINQAAETLTGWSQEEALGRPLAEVLTLVDETSGRAIDLPTIEILKDQVVILPGQRATLISRSDSRIPVSLSFSPLKDQESQVIGMVMDILDITERERLESEMLRSAKLESLGVLAGGLAHDFNNFLMSIMLNLSTARLYLRDDPKAAGMLKDAEESTRRAREITQQLATLTRGGVPIKASRYLTPLLKEAVNFSLHGSLVRPWFRLEEELWPVEIDHGQINQVLNNLAINAVQAMPEGGTLTVTTANVTVDEEHPRGPLSRGQYVEVALTDNGTGIPPEALDKIFDPYFTTKEKGSGLGLFSVYSIINKHNGWITVDSEVNKGTTFTFYLPAAEEAVIPPYSKESEAMRKIISGTGRILVMDDDELIRKALGRLLDDLGFETAYAPDGAAVLEMFKQAQSTGKPFKAAILDFSIPGGMGGVETLTRIREIDPEAKAIITSGYANAPIMAHYKDYGFQGRLAKPFTAAELSEVLKVVLGEK